MDPLSQFKKYTKGIPESILGYLTPLLSFQMLSRYFIGKYPRNYSDYNRG